MLLNDVVYFLTSLIFPRQVVGLSSAEITSGVRDCYTRIQSGGSRSSILVGGCAGPNHVRGAATTLSTARPSQAPHQLYVELAIMKWRHSAIRRSSSSAVKPVINRKPCQSERADNATA